MLLLQLFAQPVCAATVVSRHEPGRYFAGIVLLGPQSQALTEVPATGGVTSGAKITAAVVGILELIAAVARISIAPLALVATVATYLEVDTDDSQPHLPAAGREPV